MAIKPITVSQFNNYVKRILETDPLLGNVTVLGEISNLKFHGSGHVFLTLKDEGAKLSCFLPRESFEKLRYEISDGMTIKAVGYISLYSKNGTYSLNIKDLEPEGLGSLAMAFEALKIRLEKEGLFQDKHKKPIPVFPKQVAIITSDTGAAVRDIIRIVRKRNKIVKLIVVPCLVQGPDAANDLSEAIRDVNEYLKETDLIIIGRGGGSLEELWAFNEETLVSAIFQSKIPVISAVGHETDISLSDLVADKRAATPTEAGHMAVPDIEEMFDKARKNLEDLWDRLVNLVKFNQFRCQALITDAHYSIKEKIDNYSSNIALLEKELAGLNPLNIIDRGYTLVTDERGQIVKNIKTLSKGDLLTLIHRDGKIITSVEEVLEDSNDQRND